MTSSLFKYFNVKINGETHYLWRAVDHQGEVLESFVTKRRDKKAALRVLRKAMRKHGGPEVIVTDRLRSYATSVRQVCTEAPWRERWEKIQAVD